MKGRGELGPGQRIRDLRTKAHFTQSQLAEATGIKKSTIHAWEAGANKLSYNRSKHIAAIAAIAGAMGCSPDEIWGDRAIKQEQSMEQVAHLELRPIRVKGAIPCRQLDAYGVEQVTWRLPIGINSHGWYALRYTGSGLEPLVSHDDIVLVQPRDTRADGVLSVVRERNGLDIVVLRLSASGWKSYRRPGQPAEQFDGEVIGVISGILRVRSQSAYTVVFSAAGLHFEQVPVMGSLSAKSFDNT
jgi:transcriptional regulator with XRE-family HTH domain